MGKAQADYQQTKFFQVIVYRKVYGKLELSGFLAKQGSSIKKQNKTKLKITTYCNSGHKSERLNPFYFFHPALGISAAGWLIDSLAKSWK